MIPFASQRANGQDLATHLLNEEDNEQVALADIRGAVAEDLHGAIAEWKFQADALTRCQNYLYSLSINPAEHVYGRLTLAQYEDYIARVEASLGLEGQPRAIVYHEKQDDHGKPREHCHVIWSRIDTQASKAVPISFDKDKLMMATREFAYDHKLTLPRGYDDWQARKQERSNQTTQFDNASRLTSGITKTERMQIITECWRGSDSPSAFVAALEDQGYTLARGRRPYVVVDRFGGYAALPRMIDDKAVTQGIVLSFLEKQFPSSDLPTLNEAVAQAREHEAGLVEYTDEVSQRNAKEILALEQAERRQSLVDEKAALISRHARERFTLETDQTKDRAALEDRIKAEIRERQTARAAKESDGLKGVLSRVSGFRFLQRQLRQYSDRKRDQGFAAERNQLALRHEADKRAFLAGQTLEHANITRREQNLRDIERREEATLTKSFARKKIEERRDDYEHQPPVPDHLRLIGRKRMTSGDLSDAHATAKGRARLDSADHPRDLSYEMRKATSKARQTTADHPEHGLGDQSRPSKERDDRGR